ncbi:hypothetical protein PROFUN_04081 [Planoprotostelium fungivorum]|uniref:Myb-like domain-containing protein n=1 Tax=Planoprotostelium fungivorum TaxID=1890364 RepID=A0A2P6NJF9_9EUKA|nr:hypothetical protein PROFUN_04081 [Planoprotostelium fungivorum]
MPQLPESIRHVQQLEEQKKIEKLKRISSNKANKSTEEDNLDNLINTGEAQIEKSQRGTPKGPAPQVSVDEDGNLVIDEESVYYDNNDDQVYQEVFESAAHVSSRSFLKNITPSIQWSDADIEKLFTCLRTFGTNFAPMERYFPGRNRRMIKSKFKKLEKCDPRRVAAAIDPRNRLAVDLGQFKGVDLNPDEQLIKAAEENQIALANKKAKALKKPPADEVKKKRKKREDGGGAGDEEIVGSVNEEGDYTFTDGRKEEGTEGDADLDAMFAHMVEEAPIEDQYAGYQVVDE